MSKSRKLWTLIFLIIPRGVFRTQSNIYDGAPTAKKVNGLAVNYFWKRSVDVRLVSKFASDSIHLSWLFLSENNTNLPILLKARINRYPKYNMKSKINLLLPFSINSRSFAPHSMDCSLALLLYIFSFPYPTVLDTVLLFLITGPPNQISKRERGTGKVKKKWLGAKNIRSSKTSILALFAAFFASWNVRMLLLKGRRKIIEKSAFHPNSKYVGPVPRAPSNQLQQPGIIFLHLVSKCCYHVYISFFPSLLFAKVSLQMTHSCVNLPVFLKVFWFHETTWTKYQKALVFRLCYFMK